MIFEGWVQGPSFTLGNPEEGLIETYLESGREPVSLLVHDQIPVIHASCCEEAHFAVPR